MLSELSGSPHGQDITAFAFESVKLIVLKCFIHYIINYINLTCLVQMLKHLPLFAFLVAAAFFVPCFRLAFTS